jgi:hypothetical protein
MSRRPRRLALVLAALSLAPMVAGAPDAAATCSTSWTETSDPGGGFATAIAVVDANSAWYTAADGADQSYVARYDGVAWTPTPFPEPGYSEVVRDVSARADDDVWIVGSYLSFEEVSRAYVAHWDGESFTQSSVDAGASPRFFGVDAIAADDAWAVGWHFIDRRYRSMAFHWDGTSWAEIETPMPPRQSRNLYDVSMIATDDVWAVGTTFRGGRSKPLALHWDGVAWTRHLLPYVGTTNPGLFGVDGVAGDDVWAVGQVENSAGTLTMHWDGDAWSLVPAVDPDPDTNVLQDVVAVRRSLAWAVGSHDGQPLLERWNGTEWRTVGGLGAGRGLTAIDDGDDGSAMIAGTIYPGGQGTVLQRCPAA